jgi:hypothetical protein
MKSINLIFGIHNHKPIGCSHDEFEDTYQKVYKPFLSILNEYPEIPVALYYSGIILEWMEKNHPEYFALLREMLKNKQLELIGGGYFDPILSMIPSSDKLGQIELLTTYIRANFGNRPRGIWLTEQEWDPALAQVLNNCGMEYLFLDNIIFKAAGLSNDGLYYSYLTEDQGKMINVFPISRGLNQLFQRYKPKDALKFIKNRADESGERIICYFEDGENWFHDNYKYDREYKQRWLKKFLSLLKENQEWIKPVHPKAFLSNQNVFRKVYLPYYSSSEVRKWFSPVPKKFSCPLIKMLKPSYTMVKGFKQFFSRYPESNLMYSKMLYTHILVNQLRGDKYRKKASKEDLWKAQCHFAYWPNKYLGMYSHALRKEVYKRLISAEKGTRIAGIFLTSIIATDFDMDGENEYIYQGSVINVYVHNKGGAVFELDYIPAYWNYLDTIARSRENYHRTDDNGYTGDWYMRKAFLDHFFTDKTTIDEFDCMQYKELGDFINEKYSLQELDRDKNTIVLQRDGNIITNKKKQPLRIIKKYWMKKNSIQVSYKIINISKIVLTSQFAIELNLSFASHEKKELTITALRGKSSKKIINKKTEVNNIGQLALEDKVNNVSISFYADKNYKLWSFPVETLFRDRQRVIKTYQSSCFIPQWPLCLEPDEEWNVDVALSISKSKSG